MPNLITLLIDCFKNANTVSLHKLSIWKLSICLSVAKSIPYLFSSCIKFSIEQDQLLFFSPYYAFIFANHFFIFLVFFFFWKCTSINLQMKIIDIELKYPFPCYVKTWWNLVVDGHGYKRENLKVAETYGRSMLS